MRRLAGLAAVGTGVLLLAASSAALGAVNAFKLGCRYSHTLADDPIVSPGAPGASHEHDFLGNRSTDALSTHASLLAGSGTCDVYGDPAADRSAYWVPALLERTRRGFVAHRPTGLVAYYFGLWNRTSGVQRFPDGLRMIAGDGRANSPQAPAVVRWRCRNGVAVDGGTRPQCLPLALPRQPSLRLEINFPNCSNGSVDSADHKSHMASVDPHSQTCPATHPTVVPRIQLFISYATAGGPDADQVDAPGAFKLASGGHFSAHADFFDAWDPAKLQAQIDRCINTPLPPLDCT